MKSFTKLLAVLLLITIFSAACNNKGGKNATGKTDSTGTSATFDPDFKVEAEAFADLQLLRYQVPGFEDVYKRQTQG